MHKLSVKHLLAYKKEILAVFRRYNKGSTLMKSNCVFILGIPCNLDLNNYKKFYNYLKQNTLIFVDKLGIDYFESYDRKALARWPLIVVRWLQSFARTPFYSRIE